MYTPKRLWVGQKPIRVYGISQKTQVNQRPNKVVIFIHICPTIIYLSYGQHLLRKQNVK